MKNLVLCLTVSITVALLGISAPPGGAISAPMMLDIQSGMRVAEMTEPLAYDASWFGDSASTYKIYLDGKEISQGTGVGDYSWIPRAVGDHVLTYRSYSGDYLVSDEYRATFHVVGRDLVNAAIKVKDASVLYDGTERTPSLSIVLGGKTLVEGVDYELSYFNNIDAGVGFATVTGLGQYVDILDVPFTIRPAAVCSLDIESGTRKAKTTELLAYDETWAGNTNGTTRMRIMVNDAGEANNLTGVGDYAWAPKKSGQYVVKLRTYVDDYLLSDKIETAYFEFEERIPLQITSVMATPRYPWNGKVDVDFTFSGDDRDYAVTLIARDGVGGTNLVVKTVSLGGPRSSMVDTGDQLILRPGTHRLTWDADADIADDAVFDRVSVSVRVEEK